MTNPEIIDEIYAVSSFLVGNGDVCEIAARRLRGLAAKIEDHDSNASGDDASIAEEM
jgi:hypothetical protein